jgi:hypothetical protein
MSEQSIQAGICKVNIFYATRFSILNISYGHTQNFLCLEFDSRIPTHVLQKCNSGQP